VKLGVQANEYVPFPTCLLPQDLPINPEKYLLHHWILIMALFECGWMVTSIFPSSAPAKDLAAAYVIGSKKRKIPRITRVSLRVINARFPSASIASNLSI
jgi:hypothetical protein